MIFPQMVKHNQMIDVEPRMDTDGHEHCLAAEPAASQSRKLKAKS